MGIIGTAGRGDDAPKITEQLFGIMCSTASSLIDQCAEINYPIDTLISGGAAVADHVAVRLFNDNKVPNLILYFPCKWDDGKFDSNNEDGETANHYHNEFKKKTFINSLSDIQAATLKGAKVVVGNGFKHRNTMVANNSDFLLAMTFGRGEWVKNGGTSDTVRKYLERVNSGNIWNKSYHYDLNSGLLYQGCKVNSASKVNQTNNNMSPYIGNIIHGQF